MEQIQVIVEKEMIAKIRKQFFSRLIVYSFLYFATIVVFFILEMAISSKIAIISLLIALNVLFLMILSKLATTEAFVGINTTSAPKKSLKRIANAAAIPMYLLTCVFSFVDIFFLHSLFDASSGYTASMLAILIGVGFANFLTCFLIINIYEKRILRTYLTLEEE